MKIRKMHKKDKKPRRARRMGFTILCLLIMTVGIAGLYINRELDRMKMVNLSQTDEELGIRKRPTNSSEKNKLDQRLEEVMDIALFGKDTRGKEGDPAHSDTIMILSIDPKHNKIKLSSVLRDSYVRVDGMGMTKITHAFAKGGAPLAIRTLNQNFDLDIRDYVAVDFAGMTEIIDALGGVTLKLTSKEVKEANLIMRELQMENGTKPHFIKKSGLQELDGMQAVTYGRIRRIDGDFERAERQQKVLLQLFEKVQEMDATKYPGVATKLFPYLETSMGKIELLKLGTQTLAGGKPELEWCRFPVDGYCDGERIDGVWNLTFDIDTMTQQLHEYIYNDVRPVSKDPLF